MNIKRTLACISLFSLIAGPSFAYTVYNNLNHSVQVKDRHGLSGMDVTMTPNSSAACNPTSRGCYGKMSFNVYATQQKGKVICTWNGNIKKGPGNYFVISAVPGKNYPESNSCFIEYYRG